MAKKDEEVVAVGPGADDEDVRDESAERDDERREEGEEETSEGEEERVGHEDSDQEDEDDGREAIRRRRRAEKQRKRENRNRDRVELNYLRQRNEQLERRQSELDARVSNGEMVSIENKISELDGQIREAERLHGMAIEKQDGASATEAMRIMQELRAGRNQLASIRDQRTRERQAPQPRQADAGIMSAAKDWAESHDWYDPNLRNQDSRIAKAIEDQIFNEGRLHGSDPEYWEELNRRLKKVIPHRFKNGNGRNDRDDYEGEEEEEEQGEREDRRPEKRRPKGPRITVGGRERPLRKNEVYISEERKQAMMDANVWDDPVLREKYLKQYQKYDRENRRH